jgi:hypothetical protein
MQYTTLNPIAFLFMLRLLLAGEIVDRTENNTIRDFENIPNF